MTTALIMLSAAPAPAAILPAAAQAGAPPSIAGVWEAEDGRMKIEMFEAGGSYSGRLLWGRRAVEADGRTFKRDVHNPDPTLRGRSLERITILQNLKWDAKDARWEGGSLYDGTSGRSLSAHMRLVQGKLEMRGYMGSPMLGRTLVFRRVPG
ncbi:hypothetical protein COC42_08490 [Sphingomonas spermidinifaciens]|uniref:DUF2147 domain-containing protein n=2 Tax=Sphingomonas spermidinifaciens TaxID=1141889 RepID=A0A2A4B8N1_9SPHN|nr:hypothetical protein COC42_08490 [Sphingomonas spermidinifaciens]